MRRNRSLIGHRVALVALAALALFSGVSASHAAEVEGVRIDEQVTAPGGPLVLNGAGVRTKLAFIKLYVGALYLPAKKTDADEIIKDAGAKRVAMHVLVDELPAKDLTASLNNAIAANHIPAEIAREPVARFKSHNERGGDAEKGQHGLAGLRAGHRHAYQHQWRGKNRHQGRRFF